MTDREIILTHLEAGIGNWRDWRQISPSKIADRVQASLAASGHQIQTCLVGAVVIDWVAENRHPADKTLFSWEQLFQ